MSRDFKYKVTIDSDTSGALNAAASLGQLRTQTEDVMNSMARRSGAVQMGFLGIERAAKGDVAAIFGVSQAVRALWTAFSAGSPAIRILTILVMAIGAISAAYAKWKSHQDGVSKALEKSTEAAKQFHAAIKSIQEARAALNLDAEVKSLDNLTKAYERATKAMENKNKAEDSLRGERNKVEMAGIDEREALAKIAAGGNKEQGIAIEAGAERERAGATFRQGYADAEAQKQQIKDRIKLLQEERNELTGQALDPFWGKAAQAPALIEAEKRVERLREELKKLIALGAGPGGKLDKGSAESKQYLEKRGDFEKALAEQAQLVRADEQRREKIKDRLAATALELAALEKQQVVAAAQQTTLEAQLDAENAIITAREREAAMALDAEEAQKRLVELKKKEKEMQDAILRASQETADVAEEESKETITGLKQEIEYLDKLYKHQYQYATDPAYRAGHVSMTDTRTKEEAKEEERWEKKVARAQAQKARGARGKSLDDILTAAETGKGAAAAKKELEKAQQEMAINIQASANYLKEIRDNEKKLLTQS